MRDIIVRSAVELSDERKKAIESRYPQGECRFEYIVDGSLIGGISVQDGDRLYDSTVSYTLSHNLKDALDKYVSGLPEDEKSFFGNIKDRIGEILASPAEERTVGKVLTSYDGVITVSGLCEVKYGELLYIEGGYYALVFNLEENSVGALLFTNPENVSENATVFATGRVVEVPVGEAMLGRVVDALGNPIDNMGEITTDKFRPVENTAPTIMARGAVREPLETGILSIDSMIPIGRGQRELIIGDRGTGKTAIAVDTIINQKGKDVICIYVSIGQKSSTIAGVREALKEHGAMDYSVMVCAAADDAIPLQYIVPYSACAIAEEFMYSGRDVLIVYDDLSKHAVAYRAISLLLKRPPGREAYPGDIFYLHSRLLERSAKLSEELGGGSITALPIIETLAGDISAYIPTNVISITDGQIYLESELFNSGMRPAINVGLSVSRVGGSAQRKAMRKVSGTLRLQLAQYRELVVFTQFGSDIDSATLHILKQGERLTEALKQPRFSPYSQAEQVLRLRVLSSGLVEDVEPREVNEFLKGFSEYFSLKYGSVLKKIDETGDITPEDTDIINIAVKDYLSDAQH